MARTKITPSQLSIGPQQVFADSGGATITSTAYTTSINGATKAVTVIVGASGNVLVSTSGYLYDNTTGQFVFCSWQASGANTIAAADQNAAYVKENGNDGTYAKTVLLMGLTPGSTTFTVATKVSGGTGAISCNLVVIPL